MARTQLIYGIHTVLSAIRSHPDRVVELWVASTRKDTRIRELVETARQIGLYAHCVSADTLRRRVGLNDHQGVVARYRPSVAVSEAGLAALLASTGAPPLILVMDGVTDPHNLGACLRTAEAAGVHLVIVAKDRAARITPAVRKVACGAADSVPLLAVTNLARTLRDLKAHGIWLYGADNRAEKCWYDLDLAGPVALVVGAEDKGLRRLTRECCDSLGRLPMAGVIESLNISVAVGVCLYEIVRQRNSHRDVV